MATKHITLDQAAAKLQSIIAEAASTSRSARKAQLLLCAEVGTDYGWTDTDLEKEGAGKQFITAMLEKALGSKPSPGELSKHVSFARPKVRACAGELFDTAVAVRSQNRELFRSEERALEKVLKQFKSDDVSTVETAASLAVRDAKAEANKTETIESKRDAAVKRVRSAINGLADYYTGESIAALVAAIGGLEIKLPEPKAEEPSEEQHAPAGDFDLASILQNMQAQQAQQAQILAALMAQKK